jgi:acetyltransferase-like isoleucine patch superfamily enzyme
MNAHRDGIDDLLREAVRLLEAGPGVAETAELLRLLGLTPPPPAVLAGLRLFNDCLPVAADLSITREQRFLHFVWDCLDRSPLCLAVDFAVPFRRAVAQRLFGRCGAHFIAECNVTFNFGQRLEVGDDVFFNRGVFLDTKGGVHLGDRIALAEDVRVFSHKHSESVHSRRSYAPVVVDDCVTIYAGAVLLPGVHVGQSAIVAARAVVTHDVPPGMLVAGQPAVVVRERHTEGNTGAGLNDYWLADRSFQDDPSQSDGGSPGAASPEPASPLSRRSRTVAAR